MVLLVTGGAGFIGSNFILDWLRTADEPLINLDCLTYAGNLANLASVGGDERYEFVKGSIADTALSTRLMRGRDVRAVVNFAAESHVDRSISGPAAFVETNVLGTLRLLEATRSHFESLAPAARREFRFVHISTDEVFGSLDPDDAAFAENHPYRPNSPYAASKASSDHLVRAFGETYGIPVIITNCSNNYGPLQFPEKLIPLVLHHALAGRELPIYGDGRQVRDWLYVTDHCTAIRRVLEAGRPGQTYNIGGNNEKQNIEVARTICAILDAERPRADGRPYSEQISFVKDRPGHDRRYAVDATKIRTELGWVPEATFESGIRKTARWYLDNPEWVQNVTSGAYRDWVAKQYA